MTRSEYEKYIKNIEHFPKESVVFKDIMPLLKEKYNEVILDLGSKINWDEVDYIVGIESRGFILATGLAQAFKRGFIPIRKKGKLPPPVSSLSYKLEYGEDTIEMAQNIEDIGKRIILVDDVLATGGTMNAAIKLAQENQYQVQNILVLINLTFLNSVKDEFLNTISILDY